MPDLPQPTWSFTEGGRIHLDKAYRNCGEVNADMAAFGFNQRDFEEKEQKYKALFLRTLSRMLAEDGHNASAEYMFTLHPPEMYSFGSFSHLILGDFRRDPNAFMRPGLNESTTRHQFCYTFFDRPMLGDGIRAQSWAYARLPVFIWDRAAAKALFALGVSKEALKDFAKNFLKVGDMPEHGYVHQLQASRGGPSKLAEYYDSFDIKEKRFHQSTGDVSEDYAMGLHARILARLFKDSPARKQRVLSYASDAFSQLAGMQQTALGHCKDDDERLTVNEAVTYFAEITAHRLFRAIAPQDLDLQEPSMHGVSVAEAMNGLSLITPDRILKGHGHQAVLPFMQKKSGPSNTLERLELHCSDWLGGTYRAIHTLDRYPFRQGKEVSELGDLDIFSRLHENSARDMPYPGTYLKQSALRAGRMREASELRKQGKNLEAHVLEASVRQAGQLPDNDKTPSR